MMRDKSKPESETMIIDVTFEIYLKHRDEPINFNATFQLSRESIREGSEVEDVMQMATQHLLQTVDVVREHRFMLSDSRFNKGVFLTDQIQAVSILAPDVETILKALEE